MSDEPSRPPNPRLQGAPAALSVRYDHTMSLGAGGAGAGRWFRDNGSSESHGGCGVEKLRGPRRPETRWPWAMVVGFLMGVAVMRLVPLIGTSAADRQALATFEEAFRLTRSRYVDAGQTDARELVHDAISGMIEGLGDTGHSRFLTAEQLRAERQGLSGRFVGIGVEMAERDGRPVVVAAYPGSPAARAGLRPGDRFLRVDADDVSHLNLAQLGARLRGEEGSQLRITVLHPSGELLETVVRREEIRQPFVTWAALGDPAAGDGAAPGSPVLWHIRITQFGDGTASQLDQALAATREAGATGIVLDLRDNPGGLLNEAVAVAARFIEDGVVLIERGRDGDQSKLSVSGGVDATDLPLTVLINGGSASGAEVVTAALLFHQRAVAVGVTTFGTGTVLRTYPLPDGSALLLGVREWLTPAGKPLRNLGVEPTVTVALAEGVEPVMPLAPSATAEQPCRGPDQQLRLAAERLGLLCGAA